MPIPPIDSQLWTATLGNGILYTELVRDGSPSFNIENDGSTLTRQVLVGWNQIDDAKDGFLGYPQIIGAGGANQWISRKTPDASRLFLNSSNDPYLFATKVSGQGWGIPPVEEDDDGNPITNIHDPDTDTPIYKFAKFEVTYETLPYEILSDAEMILYGLVDDNDNPDESTLARYVTPEVAPGVEYLSLPGPTDGVSGFKFVIRQNAPTNPPPVPGVPGKIVPNYDIALHWEQVPEAAVGSTFYNPQLQNPSIDLCIGRVNSKEFAGLPVASLLLSSVGITRIRSTSGDRLYRLSYRFKYLGQPLVGAGLNDDAGDKIEPTAGNEGLYYIGGAKDKNNNPIPPGYYEVTADGTTNLGDQSAGYNIYDYADFSTLFKVPN